MGVKRHIYAYEIAALSNAGIMPGDVELTTAGGVQIGRADGTPLRLDNTVIAVTGFVGVIGAAGLARTMAYTVTGLRPGQRTTVVVPWGLATAVESLTLTLGAGSPAGAAILGALLTNAEGSVAFLTGVADASGVATVNVTFTATGAASFTVFAYVNGVGTDLTDVQIIAFA